MARIATLVGRPDMARFFAAEHRRLGDYINQHYWDAEHQLYNDLCHPNHVVAAYRDPPLAGKFITEIKPGVFNVSAWTFLPLFAEIAPPERVQPLVQLVQDADKGFNFPNGIGDSSRLSPPDICQYSCRRYRGSFRTASRGLDTGRRWKILPSDTASPWRPPTERKGRFAKVSARRSPYSTATQNSWGGVAWDLWPT